MREIKFRAWVKPFKEMREIVGFTQYHKGNMTIFHADRKHSTTYMDYDVALMQYTGVKDKNGKEIYEGDIVKGKRYETHSREHVRFIGEVVNVAPAFRINGVGQYKGIIHEELHRAYEVIGNIYENPELLGE